MTRGNQRDQAREKNLKKLSDKEKGQRDDGMSHAQRKEKDAEAMRLKQLAAEAKKSSGGS
jgi:hypothetical protein